jgi:hypothetical protein
MLITCFTRLTDLRVLLDPETWVDISGDSSSLNSQVALEDILTGKTLAYWDFLMAQSQWHQTRFAGIKVSTWIKEEAICNMDCCEEEQHGLL